MRPDRLNDSGGGNYFFGTVAQLAVLPLAGIVEPYEFVRRARDLRTEGGAPGDLTSSTTGVRFAGKFSAKTDYNVEMAVQRGSLGSDTISAWAGHWLVGRTISHPRDPKLESSGNTTSPPATKLPATESAARSTSSIPPRTTSTGSRTRWGGRTFITFGRASR